jgi:solute carrier family 35, member F1/2
MSGATLLNLSLLTSDMWAVLIRIFFYKQQVFILHCDINYTAIYYVLMYAYIHTIDCIQVDWLYYFAFAIVTVGLIIYF